MLAGVVTPKRAKYGPTDARRALRRFAQLGFIDRFDELGGAHPGDHTSFVVYGLPTSNGVSLTPYQVKAFEFGVTVGREHPRALD